MYFFIVTFDGMPSEPCCFTPLGLCCAACLSQIPVLPSSAWKLLPIL